MITISGGREKGDTGRSKKTRNVEKIGRERQTVVQKKHTVVTKR
jgi:hypothetical protein